MTILQPGVSIAEVEDGVILLDERCGRYWQLNATGAFILANWLDGSREVDIAHQLRGRWNVAEADALSHVAALLVDLKQKELVR